MEYLEYEYNFGEFREFLEDHEGVLYDEDYIQYIMIALQYKNKKVINYIINNDLIEIKLWNNYIALLFEYEMKESLELLLKKGIDINFLNEGNSLLDYTIINFINKPENIEEKLIYILYIIDNGGKCNIKGFCTHIENDFITENNMIYIVYIVDLLILYKLVDIEINSNKEEINLLFCNIEKNCEDILKDLNDELINILYKYYNINNTDELYICINKLIFIKKSGWSDDDLFIYHDGKNNWCFSKEDVKYIKNTKMNPLNDSSVPKYIIDLM